MTANVLTEPRITREEQFKQLEAKQREKEGLSEVGTDTSRLQTSPATAPPHHQGIPGPALDPNNSGRDF